MGPRKRWAALFAAVVVSLYWPLTRVAEPRARELWFRTVTRALVTDARGLMPPPGGMWLGATRPELPQSTYGLQKLEELLGQTLGLASFYQAWGDGAEHAFPGDVLRNLHRGGYLPMVTWEPWLGAFARWNGQSPHASLRILTSGAVDDYITHWARDAVRYGNPLLLRIAHEPSNPWYEWAPEHGNTTADYRAFWKHVRRIFDEQGARNVLFVWTPYGTRDHDFFPGAQSVDWIGLDLFNYGRLAEPGLWVDFETLTSSAYQAYAELGPPLLITETATSAMGGSKADWVRDMFASLGRNEFPKVRGLILFDIPNTVTNSGTPVDWSVGEVSAAFEPWRRDRSWLRNFTRQVQRQ